MDPTFESLESTPPWIKDAFLALRRVRQEGREYPSKLHEPLRLLLRPDRYAVFKGFMEQIQADGGTLPPPPLQMGGVPVIEGPASMREPGWKIESDTGTPSGRR